MSDKAENRIGYTAAVLVLVIYATADAIVNWLVPVV